MAGIPDAVPCTTINKVCSSGMKSISMAAQAIARGCRSCSSRDGKHELSSTHNSYAHGIKFGSTQVVDVMQKDGLLDAFDQVAMGVADATAEKHQVGREEQDAFAIESDVQQLHGESGAAKRSSTCIRSSTPWGGSNYR